MSVATAPQGVKTVWKIDPSHSLVEFSVKHMMISTVKGRFEGVTGTIETIDEEIGKATVDVEIDVSTIDTRAAQRDTHLKSPDFLDSETHPKITFKSKKITDRGDGTFDMVGDLTVRNVSKELTIRCTDNGRGTTPFGTYIAAFSGETSFNRHDFGAKWNVALEAGGFLVGDEVKVNLEIEAVKEQAS